MTVPAQVLLAAVVPTKETVAKSHDSTGQIQRWDLTTGVSLGAQREFYAEDGAACPVAAYPMGLDLRTPALVALNGKNAALNYYAVGKERPVHRFFGQDRLCAVAVYKGYLLAGNEEGKLLVWDISSGELLACVEDAHLQRVTVVRTSADGTVVSASQDGTAKVWSLCSLLNGRREPLATLSEHTGAVTDAHLGFGVARNCRLFTACMDGRVRLYDLVDFHLMAVFEFPSPVLRVLASTVEMTIYAACQNGDICIVDLAADGSTLEAEADLRYSTEETACRYRLAGHKAPVTALALSLDDGQLVSGDQDGHVIIWKAAGRQIMRRLTAEGPVRWLGILAKDSLDATIESQTKLVVGQPKRTVSGERTRLSRVRPVTDQGMASSLGGLNARPLEELGELKASYSRLLDHLFTRMEGEQMQ